jgi:hypothetical protein
MRKSKEEIIAELRSSFKALSDTCRVVDDSVFNESRSGKWTPAENFQHLVSATKMTSLAFTLPKFMHVMLYGKPRRTSHGFSKVISNYTQKLNEGAQASGVYVPKKTNYHKHDLTTRLHNEGNKLIAALENKWTDEQLDNYQISHPILGLLTVRELAYFTIYHNGHHLETVKRYYL